MDINELKRRERWYELAASIAESDRPRSLLWFWLCPFQVADEPKPAVAVPTPGHVAPSAATGVGSGAADSDTPVSHTTRRVVGSAGPPTTPPPGVRRGPATPPPYEASRISGAHTWT